MKSKMTQQAEAAFLWIHITSRDLEFGKWFQYLNYATTEIHHQFFLIVTKRQINLIHQNENGKFAILQICTHIILTKIFTTYFTNYYNNKLFLNIFEQTICMRINFNLNWKVTVFV